MLTLTVFIGNVIDAYLLVKILDNNSPAELSRAKTSIFILMLSVVPFLVKSNVGLTSLSFVITIIAAFILSYVFWRNLKGTIISCILWCLIIMASELLAITLLSLISDSTLFALLSGESIAQFTTIFVCKIITYLLTLAYLKKFKSSSKNKETKLNYSHHVIIVLTIIMAFMVGCLYIWSTSGSEIPEGFLIIFSFVIIAFLVIAIFLINQVSAMAQERQELALLQSQKEHLTELNGAIEKYNIFRHDNRHHIETIRNLLHSHDYENANAYSESIIAEYLDADTVIISNMPMLSNLIRNKREIAEERGIRMTVNLPDFLGVSMTDSDLCIIFSNLIENAFEAAMQMTDGFVDIVATHNRNTIFLTVSNSAKSICLNSDGTLQTQKKDSLMHGFGLKSVKRIADRNECLLTHDFDEKENVFTLEIGIPIQKPDING